MINIDERLAEMERERLHNEMERERLHKMPLWQMIGAAMLVLACLGASIGTGILVARYDRCRELAPIIIIPNKVERVIQSLY